MQLIKTMLVGAAVMLMLTITSCKKDDFPSRDTSGLKPTPPPPPPPPVTESFVEIDNCDKADDWQTVGTPEIVTTGQKEGKGYLQGKITSGNDFLQFIKTFPVDIDTKATMFNAQLQLWFYVQDVTLLKVDGQIQFSSAKDPDKNRIGWGMDKIIPTLKSGWNQLKLNFSDGYVSGDGGPDLKAMNFLKMFFWTAAKTVTDQSFGLDDIRVVAVPPPPPVVVDNCDAADDWQTVGSPVIPTTGQKEGKGYLQGKITAGNDFLQFIKTFPQNIDTKVNMTNGQLQFWFYVQDVSLLKVDGQIQFSSSKDPDKNRVGWGMDKLIPTLKNGWNQLTLNFSDGGITGDGGPDLGAMNFFKMFFWTADKAVSDQTFGIDGIVVQQRQ
jgi:hypothetical protein